MFAIASTSFFNKIGMFSAYFPHMVSLPLVAKVKDMVIPFFKGGSSLYLCTFGSVEIVQSSAKKNVKKIENNQINPSVSSKAYLIFHGGLLIGSGIFSLADAIYAFGVMNLGNLARANYIAGNILFLCANIISLEENVRIFNDIGIDSDSKKSETIKKSAFWGILNNLGYITNTAMILYGMSTGLTLVVAVLSCFAGGVKILYDLQLYSQERSVLL